jgi:hypothetical protein
MMVGDVSMSREERIAARLIAALDSLIPAWCAISIDAHNLDVAIDGRWEVSMALDVAAGAPGGEASLAVQVLNTIQDAIVRTTTKPWPPTNEPTRLPLPEAAVREGQLVAWFGPEAQPVVAIPPIELATV